jgi:predicted polyphosphate/ATP-dependent NAD kinase
LVLEFSQGTVRVKEGEVLDADEEAIRRGTIEVSLKGIARTFESEGFVQAAKIEYKGEVEEVSKRGIADHLMERMEEDTLYLFGPGSTTGAVMEALGLAHTLLGVDLVLNRRLVKADATDTDIRQAIASHGGPAELVVGVIGAQGFVFGRGNLQFSPEVIRAVGKKHVTILAAEAKVEALEYLLVDTGDPDLDRELSGHWRVLCGYHWNVFLPMRGPSGPT